MIRGSIQRFLTASTLSPDRDTRRLRDILALAVMVLLVTVPFLDKAFHIDDHYYIQVARQILRDPWRPYDFTWVGQGRRISAFTNYAPPLFAYCLSLGIAAFGESEVPLHCIMGLFTALAAGSMYSLASRFCVRPLFATALFLLNPLIVPGQNLMVDMPMLALALAALACHIWGTDQRRLGLVCAGGLLAGLAFVTKYSAIIIFPILLLYSMGKRSWFAFPALALGLIPFGLWSVENLQVHGVLHFPGPLYEGFRLSWYEMGRRVLSLLMILGSGFFVLLTAPRLALPGRSQSVLLIASMMVAGAWRVHEAPMNWTQIVQHILFLSGGVFLLLVCVVAGGLSSLQAGNETRFDAFFLLSWLLLAWFVPTGAPFIAVRHVVQAVPPAAIYAARLLVPGRGNSIWAALVVPVIASLGISVGWADRELANLHRYVVAQFKAQLGTRRLTAYYLGEDGFAYYCAAAGLEPLIIGETDPDPGALVLLSAATDWGLPEKLRAAFTRSRAIRTAGRWPMNTASFGVNFYRTGTVDLPWEIGKPTVVYHDLGSVERANRE